MEIARDLRLIVVLVLTLLLPCAYQEDEYYTNLHINGLWHKNQPFDHFMGDFTSLWAYQKL
ncbi:MAG: hypothetical protein AMJ79_05940 [Phycisphaerae bacterium SM23_30]|nr:MAG: hypothetical protein AMJ79_05940 [Phycisphaerae bacterium SM23_30]